MVHVVKSCTFSIPLKRLRSRIRYTFLRFFLFFFGTNETRPLQEGKSTPRQPNGHPEGTEDFGECFKAL
jgi:hypothetical protein